MFNLNAVSTILQKRYLLKVDKAVNGLQAVEMVKEKY